MKNIIIGFLFLASPAFAGTGDPSCAKTFATLRKGPGTQFPVTWKVARFMPFLKFESKSGFTKVQDLDGESHWIPTHDLTTQIHCVVVKTSVATLRQSPSGSGALADLKNLDRFTPLKKLDNQGEWVHVEDETGRVAWIHESNVWKPVRVQSVSF